MVLAVRAQGLAGTVGGATTAAHAPDADDANQLAGCADGPGLPCGLRERVPRVDQGAQQRRRDARRVGLGIFAAVEGGGGQDQGWPRPRGARGARRPKPPRRAEARGPS